MTVIKKKNVFSNLLQLATAKFEGKKCAAPRRAILTTNTVLYIFVKKKTHQYLNIFILFPVRKSHTCKKNLNVTIEIC